MSLTARDPVPELNAPLTSAQAFAPRAPSTWHAAPAVHIVVYPDQKGYIAEDSLPEMLLHDLLPPYIRPSQHTVISLGLKEHTFKGLST